ncbi:hypothetical protein Tco_1571452 [Tanacetum coccineum]
MLKGCLVFLENVTTKEDGCDHVENKRLRPYRMFEIFMMYSSEGLDGSSYDSRQVDYPNRLIHGACPAARDLIALALSEMKELSEQLKELSDKLFIRPSSSPWGARSCTFLGHLSVKSRHSRGHRQHESTKDWGIPKTPNGRDSPILGLCSVLPKIHQKGLLGDCQVNYQAYKWKKGVKVRFWEESSGKPAFR